METMRKLSFRVIAQRSSLYLVLDLSVLPETDGITDFLICIWPLMIMWLASFLNTFVRFVTLES